MEKEKQISDLFVRSKVYLNNLLSDILANLNCADKCSSLTWLE